MDDWIYHYMGLFWLVLVLVGTAAGVWSLSDTFGVGGAAFAGAIGGAGAALILSANRYIAAGDSEDDGPPPPRTRGEGGGSGRSSSS